MTSQRPVNGLCRTCGARLLWATTTHGRQIPLDAAPDPAGNQLLDRAAARLGTVQLTAAEAAAIRASSPERLYQTHFASHPDCARLRTRTPPRRRGGWPRRKGARK